MKKVVIQVYHMLYQNQMNVAFREKVIVAVTTLFVLFFTIIFIAIGIF